MKILVVDDDSITTELLESQLTSWGYEVVAFTKSVDALTALVQAEAPRLAILDWNMPIIDGPSICRSVRAKNGDHTYFILLTSNGGKQHVLKGLQAGANDYIVKPFEPDDLKMRVEAGVRTIEMKRDIAA